MSVNAEKKQYRKEISRLISLLDGETRRQWDENINNQLINSTLWKEVDGVLLYAALPWEVSLQTAAMEAVLDGKDIGFPRVDGNEIHFYRIKNLDQLKKGRWNISEPEESCPLWTDYSGRTLCATPGRAWTADGNRLGQGGGFYDQFFGKHPSILKLGIAYSCQIFPQLPLEPFDKKVQYLLTENSFTDILHGQNLLPG